MDILEYQKLAAVTCNNKGYDIDILHMVAGISSELGEIQDCIDSREFDSVNLLEECSDETWYVVNLARLTGVVLNYQYSDKMTYKNIDGGEGLTNHEMLVSIIGSIADICKRHIIYGDSLDKKWKKESITYKEKLSFDIHKMLRIINNYCIEYNIIMELGLVKNIQKLSARYPDGYTDHSALVRNLDKEREILEA